MITFWGEFLVKVPKGLSNNKYVHQRRYLAIKNQMFCKNSKTGIVFHLAHLKNCVSYWKIFKFHFVKANSVQEACLHQMLSGSHIKIWNLETRMKNETNIFRCFSFQSFQKFFAADYKFMIKFHRNNKNNDIAL